MTRSYYIYCIAGLTDSFLEMARSLVPTDVRSQFLSYMHRVGAERGYEMTPELSRIALSLGVNFAVELMSGATLDELAEASAESIRAEGSSLEVALSTSFFAGSAMKAANLYFLEAK